jgi:hypothetical protein
LIRTSAPQFNRDDSNRVFAAETARHNPRIVEPDRFRKKEPQMVAATVKPQMVLKYDAEVRSGGRIELQVPLPPGERVVVFVVPETAESFSELMEAAQSSLDFWDNPMDDEDWNNA